MAKARARVAREAPLLQVVHRGTPRSRRSSSGMYDAAGEWLANVGIPAKSGVAGGVLTVTMTPDEAVWPRG